jgi:hypothetical protein
LVLSRSGSGVSSKENPPEIAAETLGGFALEEAIPAKLLGWALPTTLMIENSSASLRTIVLVAL